METKSNPITEFHYFEKFQMSNLQSLLDFINREQSLHGRIIEMDAEETRDLYKIFIVRRLKFDSKKQHFKVLNICNKKIPYHLKINDCDYALLFDLTNKVLK